MKVLHPDRIDVCPGIVFEQFPRHFQMLFVILGVKGIVRKGSVKQKICIFFYSLHHYRFPFFLKSVDGSFPNASLAKCIWLIVTALIIIRGDQFFAKGCLDHGIGSS